MGTRPYACPVCKGKLVVKKGFYPDEPERTKCKACLNGIVFGTVNEYIPIPPTQPNYWQPFGNMSQCPVCSSWYTGVHNCLGKVYSTPGAPVPGYTNPQYGYTAPPTASNPLTIAEVEEWLGPDYLHPHTVSENE